jgi:predicted ATPase
VSGEQVFPVSPLPEDDAVELFVQRARLLEPGFTLDARSDEDVREICRRVDCLPLAVELAAAHVRTLTPRSLRDRLGQRLGLLTGGPRDLPARQQTLRETIAWSVDLLGELERDVFGKLAVFAGGATLDAAERVAGADLNTLAALVDGHLVRREEVDGEPRFGMLETVREGAGAGRGLRTAR